MIRAILAAACLVSLCSVAWSEVPPEPSQGSAATIDAEAHPELPSRFGPPRSLEAAVLEGGSGVAAARDAALIDGYRYSSYSEAHAQRVFDQQYVMSWIVFAVVLVIVGVGVWFSWLQFRLELAGRSRVDDPQADIRTASGSVVAEVIRVAGPDNVSEAGTGAKPETHAPTQPMRSEIELGPAGVKLSSPLVGLIILTLSLGFFYLYLKYVYPISDVAH